MEGDTKRNNCDIDSVAWSNSNMKTRGVPNRNRTAMGEYIVSHGSKPLTSLGAGNPAPSDYYPKMDLAKSAAPQYSIAGPYKVKKQPYNASPADNYTRKPLEWPDCKLTLKSKGKTKPYDVRADAHLNDSVGPMKYHVVNQTIGSGGPSHSMGFLHTIFHGPPNKLVQPVDCHGVDNPAPTYRPNSAYWRRGGGEKSFGLARRAKEVEGPGPADYTCQANPGGAAFSLAKRLPPPLKCRQASNTDSPGPGAYMLETLMGKSQAKSLAGRNFPTIRDFAPAPNMYTLPNVIGNEDAPTTTMTYKRVEPEARPHPGPTEYSIQKKDLPKAPIHTMSKRTRPCFPDILNYPLISNELPPIPGPGKYNEHRNTSTNDKPKYSMGKVTNKPKNTVPGPNHYHISISARPDAAKAPAYSMAKRVDPAETVRETPGPAAYKPTEFKTNSGYSMTRRPIPRKKFITPAPNSYEIPKGQSRKGVFSGSAATFKSRASPYVYTGLAANAQSA